ncbi:hypothetical protein PROFUN_16290, partial [Planoprotostelium fungivorum]
MDISLIPPDGVQQLFIIKITGSLGGASTRVGPSGRVVLMSLVEFTNKNLDPTAGPALKSIHKGAIQTASLNGHTAVVQLLLGDPRVDPSVLNNGGSQCSLAFADSYAFLFFLNGLILRVDLIVFICANRHLLRRVLPMSREACIQNYLLHLDDFAFLAWGNLGMQQK